MPTIRERVNASPAVSGGLALLFLALGIGLFVWWSTWSNEPGPPPQVYFYNTNTKELLTASADRAAPIVTDDGAEAVRAYVIGCGDCSETFVAYVEKWSDGMGSHLLRSAADPLAWVSTDRQSEAAERIVADALARCGEAKPVACLPE